MIDSGSKDLAKTRSAPRAMFQDIEEGGSESAQHWCAKYAGRSGFLSEVSIKVSGGILHQIVRWPRKPTLKKMTDLCLKTGYFSPRPYKLAQACDGSITGCVIALFDDFCTRTRFDPWALMCDALTEEDRGVDWTPEYRRRLRAQAEWEGADFPASWGADEVRGLAESLGAINYRALAQVVRLQFLEYPTRVESAANSVQEKGT